MNRERVGVVTLFVWFFGLALFVPGGITQEVPAPERIRVDVDLVPVDVIVLDEDGEPVLDLERGDFEIYENGRLRKIDFFLAEREDSRASLDPAAEPSPGQVSAVESSPVDSSPGRTFLFFFTRGRQTEFKALRRITQFVGEGLRPTDQVAVMAYNRATEFTRDHQAVATILRNLEEAQDEIEQMLDLRFKNLGPLALYPGTSSVPAGVQQKIDGVFSSAGVISRAVLESDPRRDLELAAARVDLAQIQGRKIRADLAKQSTVYRGQRRPMGSSPSVAYFATDGSMPADLLFEDYIAARADTDSDVANIRAAVEYLRFVDGEKHLLLFSPEGLFLPRAEDEDSLAAFASDSRVRIHSVHTGGTRSSVDLGIDLGLDQTPSWITPGHRIGDRATNQSALHSFALRSLVATSRLTGGLGFLMEDPLDALVSIEKATSAGYLLGYRPDSAAGSGNEGQFRRIEVRVKREGVRVYHRGGYLINRSRDPLDLERFRVYSRTASAAARKDSVRDFAMEVGFPKTELGGEASLVEVAVRMDFGAEMTRKAGEEYQGKLAFTTFFLTERGDLAAQHWDAVELRFSEVGLQNRTTTGLSFRKEYRVPSDLRQGWVKTIVYDPNTDRIASSLDRLSSD